MLRSRKIIFLTFSDAAIKAAVIEFGVSVKPKLTYTDQHSLGDGVIFDEKIVDQEKFKEEMRSFLFQNKDNFKTKEVVFGLNEEEVFFCAKDYLKESEISKEEIFNKIEPLLPFPSSEAAVRFRRQSEKDLQIIAVKKTLILSLKDIFASSGFTVLGFAPVIVSCLSLLNKETDPYLFIFTEDQSLQFGLVVEGVLAFSASLKLAKTLQNSKGEIVRTVKEIVSSEYEKVKKTSSALRNIFVVGDEAQIVKIFLQNEKLNIEAIDLVKRFTSEASLDLPNYCKNLLLSFGMGGFLIFNAKSNKDFEESKNTHLPVFNFKKLLAPLAVLLAVVVLIFGFSFFKNRFFAGNGSIKPSNNAQKTSLSTPSSLPVVKKETIATSSPASPPSAPPAINKADFTIEVLNGTSTPHLASSARDYLVSQGYNVVAIGNAPTTDYQQTVLEYKPSKSAIIPDLTSTLEARYSITTGSSLNENAAQDIIIILGRK